MGSTIGSVLQELNAQPATGSSNQDIQKFFIQKQIRLRKAENAERLELMSIIQKWELILDIDSDNFMNTLNLTAYQIQVLEASNNTHFKHVSATKHSFLEKYCCCNFTKTAYIDKFYPRYKEYCLKKNNTIVH